MARERKLARELSDEEKRDLQSKRGSLKHPLEPALYNPKLSFTHPDNRAALRFARNLYLRDYNFEQIFLRTAIPLPVFRRVRHRWKLLRERIDEDLITEIRRSSVERKIDEFVQRGLKLGLRFLDRLEKDKADLSPKDFKLISDAIMAMHRVGQLEKGEPTDIIERNYNQMTQEEMRIYLVSMHRELHHKYGDVIPLPDISPEQEVLLDSPEGRQQLITEIADESRTRRLEEVPVPNYDTEESDGEGTESLSVP